MKNHHILLTALALTLIATLVHREYHTTLTKLTVNQQLKTPPSKLIAGEVHYSRIPVEYW